MGAELKSCLYRCQVMHHRLVPRRHRFVYDLFTFCLDLDELDALSKRLLWFSRNRFNLYSFYDSDHLELSGKTVKENILEYARTNGVEPKNPRVILVTNLRVLGYVFNPVSFYFVFDGEMPVCAVAQVGNTFKELKPYFLGPDAQKEPGYFVRRTPKYFYVSPFMDLDLDFEFRLRVPAESLAVSVDDFKGAECVLVSSLTGRKKPLTDSSLLKHTLLFPLVTFKIIGLIHWNALLLFLKKIPYHPKAAEPALQKDLFHPYQPRSANP